MIISQQDNENIWNQVFGIDFMVEYHGKVVSKVKIAWLVINIDLNRFESPFSFQNPKNDCFGLNFNSPYLRNDKEFFKKNLTGVFSHDYEQNMWKWAKSEDITSWLCLIFSENGSEEGESVGRRERNIF